MTNCPCQSQNSYATCCGLYLENNQDAQTPEQLMRSRYTAFCLNRMDYIKRTMTGKALLGFSDNDPTKDLLWVGLNVMQAYFETPEKGFVEFAATYLHRNHLNTLHELSEFHKKNNCWFYVDGQHKISNTSKLKIGRNSPCPCGSNKKFKNCHEQ